MTNSLLQITGTGKTFACTTEGKKSDILCNDYSKDASCHWICTESTEIGKVFSYIKKEITILGILLIGIIVITGWFFCMKHKKRK